MTNVFFDSVDDYNDLEIHDSWRKYVVESQRVSPEDMLRYISASGRDNARTPHAVGCERKCGLHDRYPGG